MYLWIRWTSDRAESVLTIGITSSGKAPPVGRQCPSCHILKFVHCSAKNLRKYRVVVYVRIFRIRLLYRVSGLAFHCIYELGVRFCVIEIGSAVGSVRSYSSSSLCSQYLKKAYIDPNIFWTTSRPRKSTHCRVCVPYSCACVLVILQPLTRKPRFVPRAVHPDRGWHRSECEWLALLPNFNVEHHRRRENTYVFQAGKVVFDAFVSDVMFRLRMRRVDISVVPKIFPRM